MRINIEIDDKLMNDVLKATGLKTKKDAVEIGLKTLIRLHKQANGKAKTPISNIVATSCSVVGE